MIIEIPVAELLRKFNLQNAPIPDRITNLYETGINAAAGEVQSALNPYRHIPKAGPENKKNQYDGKVDQTNFADPALYKSLLGTDVLSDLTFKGGTYMNDDGSKVTFQDITLTAVLISVNLPRNIVKTSIPGRKGTVKEYIGEDDAKLNIRGIIAGPNGSYPVQEVAALKTMLNALTSIPVISRYLENMGIYEIVVDSSSFAQEEGGYSYQAFTIECSSDIPVELQISGQ